MDLRIWLLLQLALLSVASGNFVFHVRNKFSGRNTSLADFKAHDVRRHGRSLSALDLPLGGNSAASKSGCGEKHSGELGASDEALDGKLGLGLANTSIISQLAAAGKAKKMFAHCLDGGKGGGIFAIGEVVEPEISTIPLIPNRTHYTVVLKDIEVGGIALKIPKGTHEDGNSREVLIDSGTTLAYLPDNIYDLLLAEIAGEHAIVKVKANEDSIVCFSYSGDGKSINREFPTVLFHFEKPLTLAVEPDEYLFPIRGDTVCMGWQRIGMRSDKNENSMILLGDLVLSNKLVMYDLENHAIGWTDYDCASHSTKVRDEDGGVHVIDSHNVSSGVGQKTSPLLSIFIVTLFNFLH